MAIADIRAEIAAAERRRNLYTLILVLLTGATVIGGFWQSNSMNSGNFWDGLGQFFDYPSDIVSEAWNGGFVAFLGLLWEYAPALLETLNIALVSTIIGGFFAVIFAMLSTRNLDVPGPIIPVVRRIMDFMRAFPELVIALFLIFALGSGPIPAIIAVAFHTVGALGKLFSEVNENIDRKPIDGLKAVGAGWLQRLRFAVLPQVSPNYLSYLLLRLEINVRASAILGYVGAGGIGGELRTAISWGVGTGDDTAAIFILLFFAIVVIDQMSSYLRNRLIRNEAQS